jgi:hypothetical protein
MNKKTIFTGSFLCMLPLSLTTFPIGFLPLVVINLFRYTLGYKPIPILFAQLSTIWQFFVVTLAIIGLIGIIITSKQNSIEGNKV